VQGLRCARLAIGERIGRGETLRSTAQSVWRVVWLTGLALLLPAAAMLMTDEVSWSGGDFLRAGLVLMLGGLTYEALSKRAAHPAYRAGVALAVLGAVLLAWATVAVGLIGSERHPANLLYAMILGIGIAGSWIARLQPRGMGMAWLAAAVALVVIGALVPLILTDVPRHQLIRIWAGHLLFAAIFASASQLFRVAARHGEATPPALHRE
jgi:hypothetical protein